MLTSTASDDIATKFENIVKTVTAAWPVFQASNYFDEINATLKQRHNLNLWDDLFKIELGYVTAIAGELAISHPDDSKTWQPIINTIEDTIGQKDAIRDFFQGLSTYNLQVRLRSGELTDRAAYYISLADKQKVFEFPLGGFLELILLPLNAVPEGGEILSGLVKGIASLALESATGETEDPFAAKFSSTLEKFREDFQTHYNNVSEQQINILNSIIANFGKLQEAVKLISTANWPQNMPDLFKPELVKDAEIAIWKALLPVRWQIIDYTGEFFVPKGQDTNAETLFVREAPWAILISSHPGHTEGGDGWWVAARMLGNWELGFPHLGREGADHLFDALGVDRSPLFNNQAEWSLQVVDRGASENPAHEIFHE